MHFSGIYSVRGELVSSLLGRRREVWKKKRRKGACLFVWCAKKEEGVVPPPSQGIRDVTANSYGVIVSIDIDNPFSTIRHFSSTKIQLVNSTSSFGFGSSRCAFSL